MGCRAGLIGGDDRQIIGNEEDPALSWIAAYAGSALAMLALDGLWLGQTADRLYRPQLGNLLLDGYRLAPAAIFYLLYVAGVVALAVAPGLSAERWPVALSRGLVLGLVAYATYDLTNQATLRHWPTIVTFVDMSWGTILTGAAATAGYFAARWAARF